MTRTEYPRKLKAGDEVRIIAPSDSLTNLTAKDIESSCAVLEEWGLKVTFGAHAKLPVATKEQKLKDFHAAFSNPGVRAVIAATGGYNANELLSDIDYGVVGHGQKIFMGYSDITCLANAIYAKTGLVTYYGPNFGSIGSELAGEQTRRYLKRVFFDRASFDLQDETKAWYEKDYGQPKVKIKEHDNFGWWKLNAGGIGQGRLVGGHLGAWLALGGSDYTPRLKGAIVFIEVDHETKLPHFRSQLYSLIHRQDFSRIQGLLIGRFQSASGIDRPALEKIISDTPELHHLPIIANLDFGHTTPKVTLPVGGEAIVRATTQETSIRITAH